MNAPQIDKVNLASLNEDVNGLLKCDADMSLCSKERVARRIKSVTVGIAKKLQVKGEVKAFGSFANGFKTGSSDLDVVLTCDPAPDIVPTLVKFASMVQDHGFENITKIFSANVPILKFTDIRSGMEVDFCINNELGVRNSALLFAYCDYDYRVLQLGRTVKDWAKRNDLVGATDGCLNSYAYMLLVIYFLQNAEVVPNLQAQATKPVEVIDSKWGCEDKWDTKFVEDVKSLTPSENTMTVGELLVRFLHYYTQRFDWNKHAVCMRLSAKDTAVDKFSLAMSVSESQWYIEDPFDLKHNLAGKCTQAGRCMILDAMREAYRMLTEGKKWENAFPAQKTELFYLKCRISQGVTPQALLEEFEEFNLVRLHFPKVENTGRPGQAFLEFNDPAARRRAHTKNETYVADCQLALHYSTQHSLREAVNSQTSFSTYEMASYKMQRQVLAARVQNNMMPMSPMGAGGRGDVGNGLQGPCGRPDFNIMGGLPPMAAGSPPGIGAMGAEPPGAFNLNARPPPPFGPGMPPQYGHPAMPLAPGGWLPEAYMTQGMPANAHRGRQADPAAANGQMPRAGIMGQVVPGRPPGAVPLAQQQQQGRGPQAQVPPGKLGNASKAPQPKAAAAQVSQLKNKALAQKGNSKVQEHDGGQGWLNVPLQGSVPKDKQVFTQEEEAKLKSLQAFLVKFKIKDDEKAGKQVTINVDVQDKVPPNQGFLSSDQVQKLKDFQSWEQRQRSVRTN